MITSFIGQRFLDAYNQRNGCDYDAKRFFVEIYFELFFNHDKYMFWPQNSPFVQGLRKGQPFTERERRNKLDEFIAKVESGSCDASVAIGFASQSETAFTSGQITDMELPLTATEIYLSWIGHGLGVGVEGELTILFDHPEVLLDIHEGWKYYRQYLNSTPNLKGIQIDKWNGQWIAHRYNRNTYDPANPLASFQPFYANKQEGLKIKAQRWIRVILEIASHYPDSKMTGYVYSLDKTNTTIGFVSFDLPRIRYPFELYAKYFGTSDRAEVEQLFGTAFGFQKACQLRGIGIRALEPKGLREMIKTGKTTLCQEKDSPKRTKYNTYLIWLLAMLKNEELWSKSQEIAQELLDYAQSQKGAKTDRKQQVNQLLAVSRKEAFIQRLIPIVEQVQDVECIMSCASTINVMNPEDVPYFISLIRIHYAVINKSKSKGE